MTVRVYVNSDLSGRWGALSPATRVLPHCGGEAYIARSNRLFSFPHRSGIERPENSPVDCFQRDGADRPVEKWPEGPIGLPLSSARQIRIYPIEQIPVLFICVFGEPLPYLIVKNPSTVV